MLIVDTRESESLDRALKKFKKKFEKAQILKQLRTRQSYTKKSVRDRQTVLRAVYREQLMRESEGGL
ncbi:MAG TPA: 30S ribosomal protein S21 [Bacteroidetes bacterium]|mgnify:CR=1|nr:30S ribosomal protein S21 [Bacteroidota bacterium]